VQSFAVWEQATAWGINVLAESQDGLSTRFAKSGPGKWSGVEPISASTGVPLLPGALAHFECERYAVYDGGDHLILVGKVLSLGRPAGSVGAPLIFFSGRYHQLDRPRPGASEDDERLLHGW
jgi:flavin reductase (DIM6/NTAB) family NADH-FMN oxidoreductase RutF